MHVLFLQPPFSSRRVQRRRSGRLACGHPDMDPAEDAWTMSRASCPASGEEADVGAPEPIHRIRLASAEGGWWFRPASGLARLRLGQGLANMFPVSTSCGLCTSRKGRFWSVGGGAPVSPGYRSKGSHEAAMGRDPPAAPRSNERATLATHSATTSGHTPRVRSSIECCLKAPP